MLAWSVHCLFLFKAFQLFLVTYPHTVMLDVQLKFFYLSVLWNYYAYIYSFFDNISHTVCKKRPSSPWFVFLGLYFWPFVRSSFRLLQQFDNFFLTEWPEDHKNRCLSSSTNSVGLHFHEGVEKMKENDKNTKIENLQNGQEKYGGKNLAYVYSWGKN